MSHPQMNMNQAANDLPAGILLVNKSPNRSSFSIVSTLRRLLNVRKIGHAGTLDPFATGLMVMLIGKNYTRLSDRLLTADKEYSATMHLGIETDTYDCDGQIISRSDIIPSLDQLKEAIKSFQGYISQIPPMFSAKKKNGKKLYEMARKGISIEREPVTIHLETELLEFNYPFVRINVKCSKGTYIRSIAHDLGRMLGCGAHLSSLKRLRSGMFHLDHSIDHSSLEDPTFDPAAINKFLIKEPTY